MVIPMAILHIAAHRGARYEFPWPTPAQPPGEAAPAASGRVAVMSAPDSSGPLAAGTAPAGTATASAGARTVSRSATDTAHPSKNNASTRARNEKRAPLAPIPPLAATATAGT